MYGEVAGDGQTALAAFERDPQAFDALVLAPAISSPLAFPH